MNIFSGKFVLIFLLCLPTITSAEIFKWVDEDGHTHYGEKPPNSNAESIEIKKQSQPDYDTEERKQDTKKLLDIYDEERTRKNQELQEKEQTAEELKKKCDYVKNQISDINNGGVFYIIDEKGENKYLSDEEVAKSLAKLEAQKKEFCQ